MSAHLAESVLALYAGGELGLIARLRAARHLRRCQRCRRDIADFRELREFTREQAGELPTDVHWNRLAAEMKANIRVGLAAGECVGGVEEEIRGFRWREAALVMPVLLVVLAGWWLQSVHPMLVVPRSSGDVLLESTSNGIALRQDGRWFSVLHPEAGDVSLSVGGAGVLRARYVDAETGQVTITHVYAQ